MSNDSIKLLHKNRGFTLLEALIGFLILSIGMLGIASLQSLSLQAGKTSVYSSVAMMKVEELFESMRANPTVLETYESAGVPNGCSGTTNCTEVKLAQDDVYWWEKNLKAGLPDAATTTVTHTASTTAAKMDTVTIVVSWSERNKDTTEGVASSVDRSYTTTANICTAIPC